MHAIDIPAGDEAIRIGDAKMSNVVMLGALIACTGVVSLDAVERALESHLPERHRKMLHHNQSALRLGFKLARQQLTPEPA